PMRYLPVARVPCNTPAPIRSGNSDPVSSDLYIMRWWRRWQYRRACGTASIYDSYNSCRYVSGNDYRDVGNGTAQYTSHLNCELGLDAEINLRFRQRLCWGPGGYSCHIEAAAAQEPQVQSLGGSSRPRSRPDVPPRGVTSPTALA